MDIKIAVVGCGGTGGHFIAGLGEFLKGFSGFAVHWKLFLCDGDIVEEHNLNNQAFVGADIGKNKALVMREGLVEAYGLNENSILSYGYIDSEYELLSMLQGGDVAIIVGCVDNHRARQTMHRVFYSLPSCIYIDSGNDFSSGQICVGLRVHGRDYRPPRGFYFPDVMTDRTPTDRELGCGVVNTHSPQHIVTNKTAANILLAFVTWFLQEGFSHISGCTADILKLADQCGMITFKAFPPAESYVRSVAFLEKCPSKEEVMADDGFGFD